MNFDSSPLDFTVPNPSGEPEKDENTETETDASSENETSACDGSVTVKKDGCYFHCLTIIGQVEGHYTLPAQTKTTKYEHIIPRIVAVEENNDISGLLVILNTVGGDLEAGLAIAELISSMKKPSVSLVLGGGHSIGIPLAVSATRSFIVPSASMTVHPVRMNGVVLGAPQTLLYLKKMEERVVGFVSKNSAISPERFRELMLNTNELIFDFGSVLSGEEAVREGIIDRIGGLSDALDTLSELANEYKRNMS